MRIGIVSAAKIAPPALIAPAKLVDGVEVVAVAARDQARAEAFAVEHAIPHVFGSYEELCASDLIDAVYVATPAALHHRWTLAALAAGKHVLCEKPFSANGPEAAEMVAAATKADRVLMEAFHWRYHPMAARIGEICSTHLGRLQFAGAAFTVGHIPSNDIRFDLALGGGALMDLGVYPLQWVRWVALAAGHRSEPTVYAASATCGPPEVDVTMNATLDFDAGFRADIHCSMASGVPSAASLSVIGELGRLEVVNPIAPQMGNELTITTAAGTTTESAPTSTTYEHQLRAFVDAVEHGTPIPTGGTDSITMMECVDAIYRAAGLQPRPSLPR